LRELGGRVEHPLLTIPFREPFLARVSQTEYVNDRVIVTEIVSHAAFSVPHASCVDPGSPANSLVLEQTLD